MRLSALIVGVVVVLPHPAVAQDKFFDSNGVRIRYVDQGRGDPILLLHGQANNIETAWIDTGVLADLTKDHRVIAMDARGHGKSDKPHDPKAYGEEMVHDVVRLLDHLKIPRAHIVGYSMGGAINMKLLTMHPERYLTAVVGGHSGRRTWTPEEAKAAAEEAADLAGDAPFRAQILRAAPPNKPPTEAEISAITKLILANNDPLALAAVVRARRGHLISEAELTRVEGAAARHCRHRRSGNRRRAAIEDTPSRHGGGGARGCCSRFERAPWRSPAGGVRWGDSRLHPRAPAVCSIGA